MSHHRPHAYSNTREDKPWAHRQYLAWLRCAMYLDDLDKAEAWRQREIKRKARRAKRRRARRARRTQAPRDAGGITMSRASRC